MCVYTHIPLHVMDPVGLPLQSLIGGCDESRRGSGLGGVFIMGSATRTGKRLSSLYLEAKET